MFVRGEEVWLKGEITGFKRVDNKAVILRLGMEKGYYWVKVGEIEQLVHETFLLKI